MTFRIRKIGLYIFSMLTAVTFCSNFSTVSGIFPVEYKLDTSEINYNTEIEEFYAYLHDPPKKESCKQHRRFFSHGCTRMKKPNKLEQLVLTNNQAAMDTLTEKGYLQKKKPFIVHADVKIPVISW